MDLRKPNLNGIGLLFHLTLGNGFIKSAETVTPKLEMSFGVYIIYIVSSVLLKCGKLNLNALLQ